MITDAFSTYPLSDLVTVQVTGLSSGSNTIIAAVAGRAILLVSATITMQDGTVGAAQVAVYSDANAVGAFWTTGNGFRLENTCLNKGEALKLTPSAGAVGKTEGSVTYRMLG